MSNWLFILPVRTVGTYSIHLNHPSVEIMFIPWIKVSDGFQRLWASEQFVQNVDDVSEARSLGAVVLPTLKH